ncbi:MAG: hypothetical protein ACLP8A_00900 [Methylovirgula sp.]
MAEVKILARDDAIPEGGDFVFVRTRLADNNSVVTDIYGVKDGLAVKTITERQLTPEVAIRTASDIADAHDLDVIYVGDEV